MFGISAPEFIVLLAVAAIVLGPERLPQYTQQLARLVRELLENRGGAPVGLELRCRGAKHLNKLQLRLACTVHCHSSGL